MASLPKVLKELMKIEKMSVQEYTFITETKDSMEVIAEDGREYFVFSTEENANDQAVKLFIKYEDDQKVLNSLSMMELSLEDYAKDRVRIEGATSMLSYDQYHKITLNNGALVYRSI